MANQILKNKIKTYAQKQGKCSKLFNNFPLRVEYLLRLNSPWKFLKNAYIVRWLTDSLCFALRLSPDDRQCFSYL